ncbi:hypothetical protein [Aeromonas veronii]|uniref:hypothetical protein n=1 Tax=Aeromonas veronii TaxID=654 RepID=UPI001116AD19|nr:hypothetical protein [Aeromonas veronii]
MLERIMSYIESGHYTYALIVIAISFGYNSLKLLDAYHVHRKRRVEELENTIKCKYVSSTFKKRVKEELESEHFKNIYGVKTNKKCIDEMFAIHEKMKNNISFRHFIRATRLQPNIFDFKEKLPKELKTEFIEKMFGIYHLFFGTLFFLGGLTTSVFFIISFMPLTDSSLVSLISSVFLTLAGMVMIYLGAPIYSIYIINAEIKKSHCLK